MRTTRGPARATRHQTGNRRPCRRLPRDLPLPPFGEANRCRRLCSVAARFARPGPSKQLGCTRRESRGSRAAGSTERTPRGLQKAGQGPRGRWGRSQKVDPAPPRAPGQAPTARRAAARRPARMPQPADAPALPAPQPRARPAAPRTAPPLRPAGSRAARRLQATRRSSVRATTQTEEPAERPPSPTEPGRRRRGETARAGSTGRRTLKSRPGRSHPRTTTTPRLLRSRWRLIRWACPGQAAQRCTRAQKAPRPAPRPVPPQPTKPSFPARARSAAAWKQSAALNHRPDATAFRAL